jgi:lipid-binding SYLF domain-containing protein
MTKKLCTVALTLTLLLPAFAKDKEEKEATRLEESAVVLKEILGMPEGIPKDLLNKSVCVVVFPSVKKAAFVVGASYGRGVITCRSGKTLSGPWSAPAMFALEGGSFGLQFGAQATDSVAHHERSGATPVMSSKATGADASAAPPGPGRNTSAETDVVPRPKSFPPTRRGLLPESHWRDPPCEPTKATNSLRQGSQRKEIVREESQCRRGAPTGHSDQASPGVQFRSQLALQSNHSWREPRIGEAQLWVAETLHGISPPSRLRDLRRFGELLPFDVNRAFSGQFSSAFWGPTARENPRPSRCYRLAGAQFGSHGILGLTLRRTW